MVVFTCVNSPSVIPTSIGLLALDLGNDLGFPGFELGAIHVIVGRHQVHPVGFVGDALRGLQLDDFRIHGADRSRAVQIELLLLRGVELDDHVALLHRLAGLGELDDLRAGHLRSGEDDGVIALEFAAGPHRDGELGLANARRRDLDHRLAGVAISRIGATAGQNGQH